MANPETVIVQRILLALGARPDLRLWRLNTGMLFDRTGRPVKFGFTGAADIIGLIRGGRFLAIEVKTERGVQSPAQHAFQAMIEGLGGLYILARCERDAVEAVEAALAC